MELACDRCRARFFAREEPAPAETYRLVCTCGNVLSVREGRQEGELPTLEGADLELVSPAGDDPFLAPSPRGPASQLAARGWLAERDPDAPAEITAEERITAGYAVDVLVRRARLRGFLGGAAAGAVGVAAIVALLALSAAQPATAVVVAPREPDPAPREEAGLRPAQRPPPRRAAPPAVAAPRPSRLPAALDAPAAPEGAARRDAPRATAGAALEAAPVPTPDVEPRGAPGEAR